MFSVCPHLGRGVPISHNALQHYPECHGADTWGGTLPGPARRGGTLPGGTLPWGVPCWGGILLGGGYPARGYPGRVRPGQVRMGGTLPGGFPVRTTEGILTTWRAECLLRSRRRTFLFLILLLAIKINLEIFFHLKLASMKLKKDTGIKGFSFGLYPCYCTSNVQETI